MSFVVDEHPVGALGSSCAYPSLGITVRARRPRRGLDVVTPSLAKIASKTPVNLASRSRTRKRKEPVRSPRSTSRLRARRAVQAPVGWAVMPRTCTPGGYLHHEQDVDAFQGNRVHMEEVAGQQTLRLYTQERAPGGVHVPRSRSAPPGAQDPPHCRFARRALPTVRFLFSGPVSSLLAIWLIPDWSRWYCPKPSGARWITGLSAGRPRRGGLCGPDRAGLRGRRVQHCRRDAAGRQPGRRDQVVAAQVPA